MPAFLGLLTALGPAVTGAALAAVPVHPASGPAYVPRETCSYVLTFVAYGALLTGTCEGPIATWEWRPLLRTAGGREPDEALTDESDAGGRGEAPPRGWGEGEVEADGGGAGGQEADDEGPGSRAPGGEEEAGGPATPEGESGEEADDGGTGGRATGGGGPAHDEGAGGGAADGGEEANGGGTGGVPRAREGARRKGGGARGRLRGQVAVTAALSQLGTPFSWGGGSAAGPTRGIGRGSRTSGFDCSGLTLYAWGKAGVKLGHYTGTQFRQGRRVASGDLRAGDLVFFGGTGGDPTHVGLYVRDGVMIHAPRTGDVVRKTNFVKSPYFGARYRGAVRPGG